MSMDAFLRLGFFDALQSETYIRLQYDIHSKLNKEFRKLAWLGLIATVLDVTTAVTISYAGVVSAEVNILLNTLYFAAVAALGYQLMYYDIYYVYRDRMKMPFIRFHQILFCFYAVVLITNIFAGYLFSFTKDGAYVKGPAYLAVYAAPCYFVMCSAVILIYNFGKFRVWQRRRRRKQKEPGKLRRRRIVQSQIFLPV